MMWFTLRLNSQHAAQVEIRRREHLDLTDQAAIWDKVSTYDVKRDGRRVGTVRHRYGDGRWKLLATAAALIAEKTPPPTPPAEAGRG
jgi:hypothetical protein